MSTPNRPSVETQIAPGTLPQPGWETSLVRVGRKGLDLITPLAAIDREALSRAENVRSTYGGPLEVRPGQTSVGTVTSGRIHSLFRLNDPGAGAFARFAGAGTSLYRGTTGAFTSVDSGYSGDPLTFTGVSMPKAGTPYVVVSDRDRQRKISRTGSVEVFGTAPAALTSTALVAQRQKTICHFDAADSSEATDWTYTAGQDRAATPNASGTPTGSDVMGAGDLLLQVSTVVGAATGAYDSVISIARTLNLTQFASGAEPATDDDMIHVRINVSRPDYLEEIKIYFVTSTFTAGAIPGASTDNANAFFKAIRPNDFTDLHARTVSEIAASIEARENELLQSFKEEQSVTETRNPSTTSARVELSRTTSPQFPAGRNVWGEWGILGFPLRRGDFVRVGNPEGSATGWDTVTGIVIVIQTTTNQPITITFSDWDLEGGYEPDTSEPGARAYDYRVINRHSVTGAKGNPSAIQAEASWLNPVRQAVTITPTASGISAMRQDAYRRGGGAATTTDWFYVGTNSSDGGAITDNLNDDQVVAEATLEINNDQPVTSTDSSGAAVLNQTLPIYFQVGAYTFGLGDPKQPGRLYRSKEGKPEAWPADEYRDVCAHTDELICGGAYASMGFCFSRARLHSILINSVDGSWDTEPTACAEGPVSRWAMTVTPFGVAFVSEAGVRLTTGGIPERLSDESIEPLFRGETVRGLAPIDFTVPTAITLAVYDDHLWLTYQDSGGVRRQLVYSFYDKTWWPYLFAERVASVYGEPISGAAPSLLLGGDSTQQIYSHSGFSDDGAAIAFSFRTGAETFGDPRRDKTLGEIVLDASIGTGTITVQAHLNDEATAVASQAIVGVAGAQRYVSEPFGTTPQRARNVAINVSGSASTSLRPAFSALGVGQLLEPAVTLNLPTPWEELPGGEGYVWGCLITCDTGGVERSVLVEYTTVNGSVTTAATLAVTASGRRKLPFSWTPVLAHQIRLRPTGDGVPWVRWKIEWLSDPEPPRLQCWDSNWEDFGTLADKWLKGFLLEMDSFGSLVTVAVDIDQASAAYSTNLTFSGRSVQHISFAKLRGRLFRFRTTGITYSKFYRWQPIFDEEPLQLTRWETEERPFEGLEGRWQKPLEALITLRSSGTVTWQLTAYGASGTSLNVSSYTIPTTGGVKAKVRVPFNAAKGLLFAHLFTAAAGFWLYKEESEVLVEDWASGQARWVPLAPANDDLDPPRQMGNASVAAATPER